MKCRNIKYLRSCYKNGSSKYIVSWKKIIENSPNFGRGNLDWEYDNYFDEVPFNQELLTYSCNLSNEIIDFSNFTQISSDKMNSRNLFDCFHGILNYIYYYSRNKFNINEIEFHYSGSQSRLSLAKMNQKNRTNAIDEYDINNIFDYENIQTQFLIHSQINSFFGVTFKRIKINPISYSIRSGILSNISSHLVSFTFEGYDELNDKWDILDERHNINNLIDSGSYHMFFVRTNHKYYSSFKIKQTGPGSNDFWGFSISSFEIHGIIAYKNDIKNDLNENFIKINNENQNISQNDFSLSYDPVMDMTEFI